ncbi:MAG: DNA integrity scanning diadenylate cyclase DisA [Acidimicrobiales bacterium]
MVERLRPAMLEALATVAPGRALRDGLDRILQASMGALVIVGDGPDVLEICSGGFLLDAEFSPQRMFELAKMDGAIILAGDGGRIARANVHLVPDPSVATAETGTRHRTAERVARQLDVSVIAVSEDQAVITLYRRGQKHTLASIPRLLGRANQALQTLERYRDRLDAVASSLSALEVEDLVTARDVVAVLQRSEMVCRIADEVEGYIVELGVDGRLVRMQMDELMAGVDPDRALLIQDYLPDGRVEAVAEIVASLAALSTERVLDPKAVASLLGLAEGDDLDADLAPRGLRLLAKIPRLPEVAITGIVERYGNLQKIMRASAEELDSVEGAGPGSARMVKEGLARVAESSTLDHYS